MKRSTLAPALLALALVLWLPQLALGSEFISDDTADWFRYTNTQTQQEVTSRIAYDGGGWRQWESFAGFGSTSWIYTDPRHDWWWMWNGQTAELLPSPSASVGTSRDADLGPLNDGQVTLAEKGATLTTPAGTFNDVSRLDFQPSAADAGVLSIWFAKGVGVVKWTEQSIMGPVEHVLSAAMVDGQLYPIAPQPQPQPQPQPSPSPAGFVAPAEHVPMEAILWGCRDSYIVVDTYAAAWRAMNGKGVRVECAVDSNQVAAQLRYEMQSRNVPLDEVDFLVAAIDTVWMRDYGPIVLKDAATGQRKVADLDYYPGRYNDDRFPRAYATYRGWDRVHMNLNYEGGNFATDGQGQAMTSRGALWFNRDKSRSEVEREFEKLGCTDVEFFEPLIDEGTTHIDMFARIMSDTEALVSRYPASHRQAPVVDEAAQKLRALGYQVTRVDVDYRYDEYATYSNSVLVAGMALVPQYRDNAKNQAALDAYRALGYDAVGIPSELIIRYSGATHCVSMQVPR